MINTLIEKFKWYPILIGLILYSIFVYLLSAYLHSLNFYLEYIVSILLAIIPIAILIVLFLQNLEKKQRLLKDSLFFKDHIEKLEKNFDGLIFYVNENNLILKANDFCKNKMGFDPTNKFIEKVFDENTAAAILALIKDNSSEGKDIFVNPNYFHLQIISLSSINSNVLNMIIAKDITKEKIQQREFKTNENKFRNIFEKSNIGIWIVNSDGFIIDINPSLLGILGYDSKEDFGLKRFSDIVFFEDHSACCKLIAGVKEGRIFQWKSEKRLVRKDGKVITCLFNGCSIKEDEGNSWMLLSFIDDISEIKQIEVDKNSFQNLLNIIIDNIPDIIVLKDAKTYNYLVCNKAFENFTGRTRETLYNLSLANFVNTKTVEMIERNNKEVVDSKKILDISSFVIEDSNKNSTVFHSRSIPIIDSDDQVKFILSIYRDLTEHLKIKNALEYEKSQLENRVKERTYELETSLHNLEQLNIQKSKFISSLSHELRTPLNAIIGFSELLNNQFFGELNEKQLSYIKLVHTSALHLLEMINDLLNISKIDAGADSLNISKFELQDLLESIIESLGPVTDPKKIKIKLLIDNNIDKVNADKRKCKQILINLLSNAIKFSYESGEVRIKVEEENEQLKFEVLDNGIGIDPLHIDKIFSDFYQVGDSYSSPKEGAGIGLSLCRRLVNLHGGQIGVISEPEKGSNFWFTIPNFKVKKSNSHLVQTFIDNIEEEAASKNILLVEDNQINLSLFLDILSIEDYPVIVARNGAEALALAKEHSPKLILLDIFMPEMDGLTVVQKLREMPQFKKTPIIAVTASVGDEAKKAHLKAGFTDQIDKPVKVKEMLNTIAKYI